MGRSNTRNDPTGSDNDEVLEIPRETDWAALMATQDNEDKGDPGDTITEIKEGSGHSPPFVRDWVRRRVESGELIKGVGIRHDARGRTLKLTVYRPA